MYAKHNRMYVKIKRNMYRQCYFRALLKINMYQNNVLKIVELINQIFLNFFGSRLYKGMSNFYKNLRFKYNNSEYHTFIC